MTVSRALKQLRVLTMAEWSVLLLSMLLLPVIALALRFKGFNWTKSFLSGNFSSAVKFSASEDEQLKIALSVSRMVFVAANYGPYRANCLKKSLLIWWLLGRRGITTNLKIGVNKLDDDFNAHAWVEYRGNTLIDTDDVGKRFSAFG